MSKPYIFCLFRFLHFFVVVLFCSNEIDAANPHYTVTSDGLLIEPMSTSDLGVYECMAKNLMGEIKSKAARVITKKDIHNGKPI